jgi:hypothetical protein
MNDSPLEVPTTHTLRITDKTTNETWDEIFEFKHQYTEAFFGFPRSLHLEKVKDSIRLVMESFSGSLTNVTFSYPDSDVLDMILKLPQLKTLRIFDMKTNEPFKLTSVSSTVEHAFIDEGFNRINAELLNHMPNLLTLKIQWLRRKNLTNILNNRGKLQKLYFMYQDSSDNFIPEFTKKGMLKEICLIKKSFKRK